MSQFNFMEKHINIKKIHPMKSDEDKFYQNLLVSI